MAKPFEHYRTAVTSETLRERSRDLESRLDLDLDKSGLNRWTYKITEVVLTSKNRDYYRDATFPALARITAFPPLHRNIPAFSPINLCRQEFLLVSQPLFLFNILHFILGHGLRHLGTLSSLSTDFLLSSELCVYKLSL